MRNSEKYRIATLIQVNQEEFAKQVGQLRALRKEFEEPLKAQSVSNISGKLLFLLEELQGTLYTDLIRRVEIDLNNKFGELIRKSEFFSRLHIDENFDVHLLRDETVSISDLRSMTKNGNENLLNSVLGTAATEMLFQHYGVANVKKLHERMCEEIDENISLPIELDVERLSSGEKQIFVMSLYWAIMKQSKNELPFIIDTPFARIDTEHRANITEHFFKKLTGQLIILSTDEELSGNHLDAMQNQISHKYMLEYGIDKKTYIHRDRYFEV